MSRFTIQEELCEARAVLQAGLWRLGQSSQDHTSQATVATVGVDAQQAAEIPGGEVLSPQGLHRGQ